MPQFQKGNTAGVGFGRPKGARDKINTRTLHLLQGLTKGKAGADSLKKLRNEDSTAFWRIVAGLLPKQVEAEVEHKGVVQFVMKGPKE